MSVRFQGDTSGLVNAAKQAQNVLSNFKSNPMQAVSMGVLAAGAIIVGFTAKSDEMASQYQKNMNMVQALTGANTQQMAGYDSQLKQLAMSAGVAPTKLATGLYNVLSAGYSGAQAMQVLTLATQDAKIGLTEASITSNALTVALRAFNVPAKDFVAVNGMMLRTVTAGKMTMQDYASAISKTSSVAVQYKDNMSDMNAVLATLTSSGIKNANIAGTDYNNLLKVLNGNTDKMTKAIHKFDPAFSQAGFAALSMRDKVKELNQILTSHGKNFSDVVGKQQNAAAAYTMLSTHMDVYSANLKALSDHQANAAATQQAWAITQGGFAQTMSRLGATVQVLMINIGSKLLPVLTLLAGWVTDLLGRFVAWNDKTNFVQNTLNGLGQTIGKIIGFIGGTIQVIQNVVGWFVKWHVPIMAIAGVILGFLLPALIGVAAQAVIAGVAIATGFVSSIIAAGVAMAVALPGIIAGFISWAAGAWVVAAANIAAFWPIYLVVGAIIGIIALVVLAVKHWGAIAAWLGNVWSGIKAFFIGIWTAIMTALAPLINFFRKVFEVIRFIVMVVIGILILYWQLWFNIIKVIVTALIAVFQFVWNGIVAIWSVVSGWFKALFTAVWTVIVAVITPVINFFKTVWNGIVKIWNVVSGWFKAIFTAAWYEIVRVFSPIVGWFGDRWKDIQGVWSAVTGWFKNIWTTIVSDFKTVLGALGGLAGAIFQDVTNVFKAGINWIIDRINWVIDKVDGISIDLPGGNHIGFNVPHIPHLATGGQITSGGNVLLGERGAEVVSLPTGSAVYPHGSQPASNGGSYGDQTIVIQLDSTTIAQMTGDRQARMVRLRQGRRAA